MKSVRKKEETGATGLRRDGSKLGTPRPVDVHVGSRVRLRRTLLGMSQEKLGDAVGLTFQQIQKYERAANRIGASRLFQLGRVLGVPISFFFDDMPAEIITPDGRSPRGLSDQTQQVLSQDLLAKRENIELLQAFDRIKDPKSRRRLLQLTQAMAEDQEPGS